MYASERANLLKISRLSGLVPELLSFLSSAMTSRQARQDLTESFHLDLIGPKYGHEFEKELLSETPTAWDRGGKRPEAFASSLPAIEQAFDFWRNPACVEFIR